MLGLLPALLAHHPGVQSTAAHSIISAKSKLREESSNKLVTAAHGVPGSVDRGIKAGRHLSVIQLAKASILGHIFNSRRDGREGNLDSTGSGEGHLTEVSAR